MALRGVTGSDGEFISDRSKLWVSITPNHEFVGLVSGYQEDSHAVFELSFSMPALRSQVVGSPPSWQKSCQDLMNQVVLLVKLAGVRLIKINIFCTGARKMA